MAARTLRKSVVFAFARSQRTSRGFVVNQHLVCRHTGLTAGCAKALAESISYATESGECSVGLLALPSLARGRQNPPNCMEPVTTTTPLAPATCTAR